MLAIILLLSGGSGERDLCARHPSFFPVTSGRQILEITLLTEHFAPSARIFSLFCAQLPAHCPPGPFTGCDPFGHQCGSEQLQVARPGGSLPICSPLLPSDLPHSWPLGSQIL